MNAVLDLVVLRVADVDAAARFYRSLGFVLIEEHHERGPRHFSMQLGGVTIELYPRGDGPDTSGLMLGLSVEDPEACVAAALAHGGTRTSADGTIRDLDGHRLVLRGASQRRPLRQ